MFEPSITSQILGAGGLVIGFFAAAVHANQAEKREQEEKRRQEEEDTQKVNEFNNIIEIGRKIERQQIRKNIRRPFPGFTYDNEKPEGLKPELIALPAPKEV